MKITLRLTRGHADVKLLNIYESSTNSMKAAALENYTMILAITASLCSWERTNLSLFSVCSLASSKRAGERDRSTS